MTTHEEINLVARLQNEFASLFGRQPNILLVDTDTHLSQKAGDRILGMLVVVNEIQTTPFIPAYAHDKSRPLATI